MKKFKILVKLTKIMKKTIFGKNELTYLKNMKMIINTYSKNYIYQIRYSIRKKVSNLVLHDLKLILDFDEQKSKSQKLIDHKIMEFIALKILKNYPYFISKLLKLPEVQGYLGKRYKNKRI